jgi:hypothetical protein
MRYGSMKIGQYTKEYPFMVLAGLAGAVVIVSSFGDYPAGDIIERMAVGEGRDHYDDLALREERPATAPRADVVHMLKRRTGGNISF